MYVCVTTELCNVVFYPILCFESVWNHARHQVVAGSSNPATHCSKWCESVLLKQSALMSGVGKGWSSFTPFSFI